MTITLHPRTAPDDFWQTGRVLGFEFAAKVYGFASPLGIDGGRISKLSIRTRRGREVVNYDRGWDRKPKARQFLRRLAIHQVLARFN